MRPSDVLAMSVQQIANLSIAEILAVLIKIPSVNPLWQSQASGIANEKQKAEFLFALFRKLESFVKVDIQYVTADRPNVIVRIQVNNEPWLVWDTHTDTVGVEGMKFDPFVGQITEDRVCGRGACDTLASIATAIKLVFSNLTEARMPNRNLLLAFTMGEENGGEGAKALNPWLKQEGIVVKEWITSEPTMLQAVFAHNGVTRGKLQLSGGTSNNFNSATSMSFKVSGRSGHTSNPDGSISALTIAARLIIQLEAIAGLHVAAIECGGLGNTIPNSCNIVVEQDGQNFSSRNALMQRILGLGNTRLTCIDPDTAHRATTGIASPLLYTAAKIILAIDQEHRRLKTQGTKAVTGSPVISATGLIGRSDSELQIFIDRRNVPGEDAQQVFIELIERLRNELNSGENLHEATDILMRKQAGFETPRDSTLVRRMVELTNKEAVSARYGTNLLAVDPSIFVNGQINAIVFGPGDIAQAHTVDEYIEISQLVEHAKIMAEFLGFK